MGEWPVEDIQARKYNPEIDAFRYEKDFQQWLMNLARVLGYNAYHTHQSRYSPAGFPDTVMVRGSRLIFAELKTPWRPNPTEAQRKWLDDLVDVTENSIVAGNYECPEVYLWRTWEMDEIMKVLKG